MLVKEIMRRPLVISKDVSIDEAARIMANKSIGSLLFVSGGSLKGIVTERDLIKNFGKHNRISKIMTKRVSTIEPDVGLDVAAQMMRSRRIKRLPVVKSGKLVGIVTLTDMIAHFEGLDEHFFFE